MTFGDHLLDKAVFGDLGHNVRRITFMLMAAVHYASPKGRYNDRSAAEERKIYSNEVESVEGAHEKAKTATDNIHLGSKREDFKTYVRGLSNSWHSTKMDKCVW